MIIGIDEVGRGCWAGPLVAGAAVVPDSFAIPMGSLWTLADSKQLSKARREAADIGLRSMGVSFGLGWVTAQELDDIGMSKAVALAMERAYDALPDDDKAAASQLIIDGSINYLPHAPGSQAMIKADGSVPAVSAASIIAKVARDNWMAEAAQRFAGYGFEKHVGYGTRQHQQAIAALGLCELHRRSFRPVAAAIAD